MTRELTSGIVRWARCPGCLGTIKFLAPVGVTGALEVVDGVGTDVCLRLRCDHCGRVFFVREKKAQ